MKRTLTIITTLAATAATALLVSCDWSSGGSASGFNTSRTNLQVNLSGTYSGQLDGKAVSATSRGNITRLIIQQSGNVVEISDNQGSTYRGSVGIPNVAFTDGDGAAATLPLGSELASYTISWAGHDNVADKNIRFTGNVEIIAVSDIDGRTITDTVSRQVNNADTGTSTSGTGQNTTTITTTGSESGASADGSTQVTDSQTISTVLDNDTIVSTGQGGTQVGNNGESETDSSSVTVATAFDSIFNNGNSSVNNSANSTVTASGNNTGTATVNTEGRADTTTTSDSTTVTETVSVGREFVLSGQNTQHRLVGSWIEEGGIVGSVNALSQGAGGIFQIPIAQEVTSVETAPTQPAGGVAAPAQVDADVPTISPGLNDIEAGGVNTGVGGN